MRTREGDVEQTLMRTFSTFSLCMLLKPSPCFKIHLFQEAFSASSSWHPCHEPRDLPQRLSHACIH